MLRRVSVRKVDRPPGDPNSYDLFIGGVAITEGYASTPEYAIAAAERIDAAIAAALVPPPPTSAELIQRLNLLRQSTAITLGRMSDLVQQVEDLCSELFQEVPHAQS